MVKAKDIVQGKIQLENLSEPYVFVEDNDMDRLAQAVNILAKKKRYRVVSYSMIQLADKLVCMERADFFNHRK